MSGFGWEGGASASGMLQLQGGVPLDTTLRPVTDMVGTVSPLSLSTNLLTINSNFYAGNNTLVWDNAENNLHVKRVLRIGNNSFTPYGYGSALFITGTVDYTTPGMTYEPFIHLQRYGGRNVIRAFRINGTPEAPAAVLAGQELYGLQLGAMGPSLTTLSSANLYFIRTKTNAADVGFEPVRHEFFTSGFGATAAYYLDSTGLIIRDTTAFDYTNNALASLDVRPANQLLTTPTLRVQSRGTSTLFNSVFVNSSGTNLMTLRDDGAVSLGTASPNASAIFQIDSTTRGFLPPRMTTAQRDLIASPAAGLVIYNTTSNKLNVFTTVWEQVTSA